MKIRARPKAVRMNEAALRQDGSLPFSIGVVGEEPFVPGVVGPALDGVVALAGAVDLHWPEEIAANRTKPELVVVTISPTR